MNKGRGEIWFEVLKNSSNILKMTLPPTVTDEEIENGLSVVAQLIDWYGDAYWPIFECLESELEERRSRTMRLRARLKVSANDHKPLVGVKSSDS